LIARLGSSQNKILLWRAPLTMIISYDLCCTEQPQTVLAMRSLGEISLACEDGSPQADLSVQKARD